MKFEIDMNCLRHSARIYLAVALLTVAFHDAALSEAPVENETSQSAVPVVVPELQGIKTSDRIRLGSQVTICIKGLHQWIKEGNDPNSLRLFLGGHMLSSTEPAALSPASQEYVNFVLEFDSTDKHDRATWAEIFDAVRNSEEGRISVTVGDSKNRQAFESDIYATFVLYPWFTRLALLLVIVLLVILVMLATNTDLLRDTSAGHPEPPDKTPLSLGRVQMAWWFYLVIAAYVYIWLVTQVPHIPTGSKKD
jgi:hypothetical protein